MWDRKFIQSVSPPVLPKNTIRVGLRVLISRNPKRRLCCVDIEEKLGRLAANNAGISEVRIERKADQLN